MTIRYALILGNNVGLDDGGREPFPPLKFAEREATLLKKKLVSLSNFDASSQRTRLLIGATRSEVKAALRSLVRQQREDRKALGNTEALFLFYFTGHGRRGKLLLEDGPLTADELGEMFRTVDADFSVAVFDACYSGSLEEEALKSKGLLPMPGFDLFRELPEEVLSAKGSIWYVSSGPGQASYEDESVGGVFTHFFIEGLSSAPRDGPGITLDRIWDYARRHTVEYTAARKRRQIPEQFISKLKASAPVYFSFPIDRSATLVLAESIHGQFVLSYADGHLSEFITKRKGEKKRLAVYPGSARLMRISGSTPQAVNAFRFFEGREIVLSHLPEEIPAPSVGERTVELWEKGVGLETPLRASMKRHGLTMLGGLGYSYDASSEEVLLPQHGVSLSTRLDYAEVVFGLSLGYGLDARTFEAWHYKAHSITTSVYAGYGLDVRAWRLLVAVGVDIAHMWQEFSEGDQRAAFAYRPMARVGVLYPTNKKFTVELFVHGGPTRSPAVRVDTEIVWYFSGGVGLACYYRLI